MKRIIFSSVALVFCALMIAGAILQLQTGRVECGGETMQQGDICVSKSRYGRVTESTLEQSKTSAKVGAIAGIAIGAVGILIAAQNLKIGIRNRRTAKAGAVAGSPWPDAPLAPPQQYSPEQQHGFPQQHRYSPPPAYSPHPPAQVGPQQQYSPAQGFPHQQYSQQQYAPQQDQSAQYPPQQHYYQPPQHQYYQQPGSGDARR